MGDARTSHYRFSLSKLIRGGNPGALALGGALALQGPEMKIPSWPQAAGLIGGKETSNPRARNGATRCSGERWRGAAVRRRELAWSGSRCVSRASARTRSARPLATAARLRPRRAVSARKRAPQAVAVVRPAAWAATTRKARRPRLPLRVWPLVRWPALSWLPGHLPAHAARGAAEGNWPLSRPIAALSASAVSRPPRGGCPAAHSPPHKGPDAARC